MSYDIDRDQVYTRPDGARAIVSHVLGRIVFYRREPDGDLLCLSIGRFRVLYTPTEALQ